jgi:hypothetical protein
MRVAFGWRGGKSEYLDYCSDSDRTAFRIYRMTCNQYFEVNRLENRTMGTLVKDARGRSKFWYYCYRGANGRRLKKSTKETDRRNARIIGESVEESEDLAKRGNATEEQIRKVISETLARVTGRRVYDPTVREWLDKWLANEKSAVSDATLTRYRQSRGGFLERHRASRKSTLGSGHK